jgi:hypothetical protein
VVLSRGPDFRPADAPARRRDHPRKALLRLHQELPYSSTVETEKWEEKKDGSVRIEQVIYVERDSQKKIVLGEKGRPSRPSAGGAQGDRRNPRAEGAPVPVREGARELGRRPRALSRNGAGFPGLDELGFGLDLSCCAATGSREELIYVSPKSGRAVSAAAGRPWHDQLLALPSFLDRRLGTIADLAAFEQAYRLTSFFFGRHVYEPRGIAPPDARAGFVAALRRAMA